MSPGEITPDPLDEAAPHQTEQIQPLQKPEAKPKKSFSEKFWKFINVLEVFMRYGHGMIKGLKDAHGEIAEEDRQQALTGQQIHEQYTQPPRDGY